MARLTLSTVGIKSPLDVAEDAELDETKPATRPASPNRQRNRRSARSSGAKAGAAQKPSGQSTRAPAARTTAPPAAVDSAGNGRGGGAPFYGSGRPLQTSIALDEDCAQLLEHVGRAAGVSVNALVVASLQAGLPPQSDAARDAIVDERVRRAGISPARVEHNLRLPEQLRTRIDELTAAARERLPRVARADLVNAALRAGLPDDPERARSLVVEHGRRREDATRS